MWRPFSPWLSTRCNHFADMGALKVCAHQIPVLESGPDEFRHRVAMSFQTRGFLTHFTPSQFASSLKITTPHALAAP
jgi:hypothetical protein